MLKSIGCPGHQETGELGVELGILYLMKDLVHNKINNVSIFSLHGLTKMLIIYLLVVSYLSSLCLCLL